MWAVITALCLACLLAAGCGGTSGPVAPTAGSFSHAAGVVLGRKIAVDHPSEGEVILIHRNTNAKMVKGWEDGLKEGLDDGTVVVFGPDQMSPESLSEWNGGFPALQEALSQYPDARALVTTLSIRENERPTFPPSHPPIYALDWSNLPSAVYLFRRPSITAGVFARPDSTEDAVDANAEPQALFDAKYLLVDRANIREALSRFR
jgi:hypothetical protein